MLFTIDRETVPLFMKNTLIGNFGISCCITNNDTGLYDVTNINKLLQGILSDKSAMKKNKLCMTVSQVDVDGSKWLHAL